MKCLNMIGRKLLLMQHLIGAETGVHRASCQLAGSQPLITQITSPAMMSSFWKHFNRSIVNLIHSFLPSVELSAEQATSGFRFEAALAQLARDPLQISQHQLSPPGTMRTPGRDTALPARWASTERALGLMPGARPGPSGPMGLRTGLQSALAPGGPLTGRCCSGPAHGPTIGARPHAVRAVDAYGPTIGTSGIEPAKGPWPGSAGAARGLAQPALKNKQHIDTSLSISTYFHTNISTKMFQRI